MAVVWTEEQQRAISTVGKGVIVPAAAGSGKTAVLIERVVRLLADDSENGCPAEKLLAVTFTKAAASQMKTKLNEKLSERLVGETDSHKRRWLQRQQEMLPLARISTINSFCLDLVKNNPEEFDYRSGITVAEDNQAANILLQAFESALDEMFAQDEENARLLVSSFVGKEGGIDISSLTETAEDFRQILHSLPFPKDWEKRMLASFYDKEKVDGLVKVLLDGFNEEIDKAVKLNEKAVSLIAEAAGCGKRLAFLQKEGEKLKELQTPLAKSSYENLYEAVTKTEFGKLETDTAKKGLSDIEIANRSNLNAQTKKLRDDYKEAIVKIQEKLHSMGRDIYTPIEKSGEIFAAVCSYIDRVDRIDHEKKLELGIADFNDIERMALNLLVELKDGRPQRTELAEKLVQSGTYKIMLIDEYQDVNNLQEMIFRVISDTDDLSCFGKNVFVVGDMKQSIYRFRLSNPILFKQAAKSADDEKNVQLEKIRLSKNFRSRKNIIDLVNFVFAMIMSEQVGEVEYNDEEKLVYGAGYGGEDFPTELMLMDGTSDSDEDDKSKYVNFGEEEYMIASRIKELIDSGEKVCEGDTVRECMPQDFCVLVRTGKGCRRIGAALKAVGLKSDCEKEDGYMGSSEIMTMMELLKVIDNPMKDISMAAVMMSPIMSFTAEEMANIRLLGKKDKKRIWQTVLAVSKSEDADSREAQKIETGNPLLEEKCAKAESLIKRLRFYSVSMTLEQLISRIYDETGFFAVASVYENSKQKRANLRLLTQLAAEYESSTGGTIGGFVRYMESVRSRGKDFAQAVTVTADDAVAVKTIHSSKGLEYPFVFLANLHTSFQMRDVSKNILVNEAKGVGISYYVPENLMKVNTAYHYALEKIARDETLSEEMRLLYVALTRAKERLFIPFYLKKANKGTNIKNLIKDIADEICAAGGVNSRIIGKRECYIAWIAAAVLVSDKNETLLNAVGSTADAAELRSYCPKELTMPSIEWNCSFAGELTSEEEKTYERPTPDADTVNALLKKYAYEYPNRMYDSANKRTVTEIVRELHERENEEADKLFYPQLGTLGESAKRLTAAQRGTYTHLFMQEADYTLAETDVRAELERLKKQGIFSEREAGGVYVSAIEAFFRSDFYSRMKKSSEIRREMKFMVQASDAALDKDYGDLIAADGMLQGVCDCIFKEADGYVLVDYKTDNFTDLSELDKYAVQLDLYKRALDLILPMAVKSCYIYSFKLARGKEIKV